MTFACKCPSCFEKSQILHEWSKPLWGSKRTLTLRYSFFPKENTWGKSVGHVIALLSRCATEFTQDIFYKAGQKVLVSTEIVFTPQKQIQKFV